MVLADLISNIGGLLGVFIGYSIISFIEIIELLIAIIVPNRKKNEDKNSETLVVNKALKKAEFDL
jgi:hypothetical protein